MDPKRARALVLLADGASSVEVATALQVNRCTVNRWRADPEFTAELRALIDAQVRGLAGAGAGSEVTALVIVVRQLQAQVAALQEWVDEMRIAEVTPADLNRSLGAQPIEPWDPEREREFEAEMVARAGRRSS